MSAKTQAIFLTVSLLFAVICISGLVIDGIRYYDAQHQAEDTLNDAVSAGSNALCQGDTKDVAERQALYVMLHEQYDLDDIEVTFPTADSINVEISIEIGGFSDFAFTQPLTVKASATAQCDGAKGIIHTK